MILFVYGQDTFSSHRHVKTLRAHFEAKYDPSKMNVDVVTVDKKTQIGAVASLLLSPGFLSDRRMVILKDLMKEYSTKPTSEPWIEVLSRVPKENIVILQESISEKKIEKHHLVKTFSGNEQVHTYAFPEASPDSVAQWIKKEVERRKIQISPALLRQLTLLVGNDMHAAENELRKIEAYTRSKELDKTTFEGLVKGSGEEVMFALIDAISAKEAGSVVRLLEQQRMSGTSDFQIYAMLVRQLRLLGIASMTLEAGGDLVHDAGIHPFVARKLHSQVRAISKTELAKWHAMASRQDAMVKQGQMSIETALERIISEILLGKSKAMQT